MPRFRIAWLLVAPLAACGAEKQNAPRERPPLTVAPPKASADSDETGEPPARAAEAPNNGEETESITSDDVQVDVQRDGGHVSISARTVKDGGLSFRMSGSIRIDSDGGSVHITIGGDAGSP